MKLNAIYRGVLTSFVFAVSLTGCSKEDTSNSNDPAALCVDPAQMIFKENEGIVIAEFENAVFSDSWQLENDLDGSSGSGYMVWKGNDNFNTPGEGMVVFRLEINTPGTYRFLWKSAVTVGDNGTEHNDTWLRFSDAADFYAERDGVRVYPGGTGKTPNPEGSSKDGWFKVYRSGNDLGLKWQANTSDNDARPIFVFFNEPGIYTMEVSGRSSGHGIDKFALFTDSYRQRDIAEESLPFSEIGCGID